MDIEELLEIAKSNTKQGSKNYYRPLPPEQSKQIREYFKSRITIPIKGNNYTQFYNKAKTLVAIGYNRVVIGDYGAYLEFNEKQIKLKNIKQKWSDSHTKDLKYIWFITKDEEKTKIYYQKKTVPYADYKIGKYYIHVSKLIVSGDT